MVTPRVQGPAGPLLSATGVDQEDQSPLILRSPSMRKTAVNSMEEEIAGGDTPRGEGSDAEGGLLEAVKPESRGNDAAGETSGEQQSSAEASDGAALVDAPPGDPSKEMKVKNGSRPAAIVPAASMDQATAEAPTEGSPGRKGGAFKPLPKSTSPGRPASATASGPAARGGLAKKQAEAASNRPISADASGIKPLPKSTGRGGKTKVGHTGEAGKAGEAAEGMKALSAGGGEAGEAKVGEGGASGEAMSNTVEGELAAMQEAAAATAGGQDGDGKDEGSGHVDVGEAGGEEKDEAGKMSGGALAEGEDDAGAVEEKAAGGCSAEGVDGGAEEGGDAVGVQGGVVPPPREPRGEGDVHLSLQELQGHLYLWHGGEGGDVEEEKEEEGEMQAPAVRRPVKRLEREVDQVSRGL